MRSVLTNLLSSMRPVPAAAVVGLLLLGACASKPDLAPKAPVQQAQAAKPTSTAPTSTLQAAPGGRPSVLAPNQLIPGFAAGAQQLPLGARATRPSPDAQGLVRVGMLLPLSGQSAPVGRALLNAAQVPHGLSA